MIMKARSLTTVLTVLLLTVGCVHEPSDDYPDNGTMQEQVSLSDLWTVKGKLLVTAQDANQSARFTWEHHPSGGDTIVLSDTLGLGKLVLRHRDGTLFLQGPDKTLVRLRSETLPEAFSVLLSIPPRDFARALTGQPLISPVIDTKVSAWQSIGKKTAPKVVRLQSGGIAIKVVINHWELAEDV